jgi:drug/metabolite transporter superfamily protein YnfA
MSWITKTTERAGIAGEFIAFLWERKLWWMIPMVVVLMVFGMLIVFAQNSALAPFIYTLF